VKQGGVWKRYRVTRTWYVNARSRQEAEDRTRMLGMARDVDVEQLDEHDDAIYFLAEDADVEYLMQPQRERASRRPAAGEVTRNG
jgi:hypothetical protein